MIIESGERLFLAAPVDILRGDRVVAEWTNRSIIPNDKFLYIQARYVEADKPNENRHFWAFEELQEAQHTIANSPINVMHRPNDIVGVMLDSELMFPNVDAAKHGKKRKKKKEDEEDEDEVKSAEDEEVELEDVDFEGEYADARDFSAEERRKLAKQGKALPDGSFPIVNESDLRNAIQAFGRAGDKDKAKRHIIKRAKALGKTDLLPDDWNVSAVLAYDHQKPWVEVLGALWRFYFPKQIAQIEAAQEMGALAVSMECSAESVTRVDKDGTTEDFPFMGGSHEAYNFTSASDYLRLNKPHFLGCGLVLPPAKPGWKGAEVKELTQALTNSELEDVYAGVQDMFPNLDAQTWENMMLSIVSRRT